MRRAPDRESGFALVLVFFMAAVIAISLYIELPRVALEAQRDKEQLLIDRGEQYKRAIQLFFRRHGSYPPTLEALENTNNIRYLRRRYKDPMTGKDEWRIIHAGPGGILTDSKVIKPPKQQQGQQKEGGFGTPIASADQQAEEQQQQQQPQMATLALRRRRASEMGGNLSGAPVPETNPQYPETAPDQAVVNPPEQPDPEGENPPGQQGNDPGAPGQQQPGQPGMFPGAQNQPGQFGTPIGTPIAGQPPFQPGGMQIVPGQTAPDEQPGSNPQFDPSQPGMPSGPGMPSTAPVVITPGAQPGAQPGDPQALPPQWRQPQAGQYPPSPQPYPPPNPQAPYGSQPPVYGSQAQPGFPYQRRNPGGLATQQPGTGTGSQPAGPGNVPDLIRQILTNPRQQGGFGQPGGRQIGAGIAGVATTLEAEGVKIYNERTKYDEWEFVYDPQKDMRSALGGPAIGQPQQQQGTGEQSQKPAPAFTSPGFGSRKR